MGNKTDGIRQLIANTGEKPVTRSSIRADLQALGVQEGMTLLVHSSLSSLGWVCGGPVAVIQALIDCVGESGTVMMPTHTGDLSEPSQWSNPPVPAEWWPAIREEMPAFHPDYTPTYGMGAIVECFRKFPGVMRSSHPQLSFAAWGAQAGTLLDHHSLAYGLGEQSPLARLYELEGFVLLLGVGHESNTSLHLAEYRGNYATKIKIECKTAMWVKGERQWVHFPEIGLDSDDFGVIGEHFQRDQGLVAIGQIGLAQSRLMPQRALVDYGVEWMEKHRQEDTASSS